MTGKQLFSGAMSALEWLADLFILSVLFLLCSLPLVSLAASASAAYYVLIKNLRGHRGGLSASFFAAFRGNLKQTWPISLLLVFGGALLWVYSFLGGVFNTESLVYLVYWLSVLLLLILLTGTALYAIPMAARTHLKAGEILRNSLLLALRNILRTLLMIVLLAGCVWLLLNVPILILILPAGYALLCSYIVEPVLDRYTDPEGLARWRESGEAE